MESTLLEPPSSINRALPDPAAISALSMVQRSAASLECAGTRSFRVSFTYNHQRYRTNVKADGPTHAVLEAVQVEQIGAVGHRSQVCSSILADPGSHGLLIYDEHFLCVVPPNNTH